MKIAFSHVTLVYSPCLPVLSTNLVGLGDQCSDHCVSQAWNNGTCHTWNYLHLSWLMEDHFIPSITRRVTGDGTV